MVGVIAAGGVAASAVDDQPPLPVEVSDGVTVIPPADWEFGGRSEDGRTILISKGSGSLAVTVTPDSDVVGALNELRGEWLASGTVTAAEVESVRSARPGATAYGFAYSGTFPDQGAPVEGEVSGYQGSSVVVLFDGWGSLGQYQLSTGTIEAIIRDTVIP